MKIGFFGGTFNPPHLGHILASTYALKVFDLDEIWLAPVFQHPFAKTMIPFEDRLQMCQLLVNGLSPPFRVTDVEKHLNEGGKTVFTLRQLKKENPQHEFSLIIGSDLKDQITSWNSYDELKNEFPILVVPRGLQDDPTSIPNISSTNIRADHYDKDTIKNMVTPEIYEYMIKHKIY
jgi:nicotinate-nucleotide adenylyltransferase